MSLSGKKLKELCKVLAPSDRLLVLMKPDPDALSSAWALKRVLGGRVQACGISHVGDIQRLENRAMVRILKIPTERFDKVNLESYNRFAIVDGQPDQFSHIILPQIDLVIDHHPVVKTPKVPFADLRPKVGATATILTRYLQEAKLKIQRPLATALAFGIKTDTNSLTRSAAHQDVEAYAHLLPKTNMQALRQIEYERISRSDLGLIARAIAAVQIRRKFLYVFLEGPVPPDSLVILADIFIGVENISVVAVGSTYRNRIVVIHRGRGTRVDVGRIARDAFSEIGSAGGHRVAARAELRLSDLPEPVASAKPEEMGVWVKKRLLANLSSRKKKKTG